MVLATLAAPSQAAVVISQVYGGGGNAGATLQHDFIEIFNNGGSAVSIGGWSVQYAAATGTSWQVTTIPAGTSLPAGRYYLIRQAAGTGGTVPVVGDITGTIAMGAASGKVALANNSTAFTVAAPTGATLVDILSYGASTPTEGTPTAVLSATLAALRNSGGCVDTGNNVADFSVVAPAPRSLVSNPTPVDCGNPPDPDPGPGPGPTPVAAAIYTIQGSGATSPLAGQVVITSGVVTKVMNNGFFIQDLTGDGNPATSDGIFVFTSTAPPAAAVAGNMVQVTGTVVEFSSGAGTAATPLTEIGTVTAVNLLGSGYTITPTLVTLPLAAGDTLERFEGMLVRFTGSLTVQQNYFQARYGQLTLGAGGRHETPTNRFRPGSPAAIALADEQARGRILLDDGSSLQNVNPTPYFGRNGTPRAGDALSNLVGALDFGLATATASGPGLYRLQPVEMPLLTIANPRPAAPNVAGNLKLGSMNVLNFFTTFTNGQTAFGQTGQGCSLGGSVSAGNCRGADGLEEYLRQRDKIVRAIAGMDADAVGLMEIQNNGNVAVQAILDSLNSQVRSGPWAAVSVPAQGTGTDAIRVAMIYKPARLTPVGGSVSDPAAINNRPTLAQTFQASNGAKFTFVVNHLKSKGSCPATGDANAAGNLDTGDGQGCWNAQRVQQAQQLRTFVAQLQQNTGVNDVMLVGDFNAYGQEDPIFDLTSNGYVDQSGRFEAVGYSYIFDGTSGRLDHAISSASMSAKVVDALHWHINADEQLSYDYNLEFKQPACATCAPDPVNTLDPYRSSDHDPVIIGVDLFTPVTARPGSDTVVGTRGDDIIVASPGARTLTGAGGSNVFLVDSMRSAGATITDFVPGRDQLDLRALLAGLGYRGSNPVADGVVRFVALGANATSVEIDNDGAGPARARPLLTLQGVSPAALKSAQVLKQNPVRATALR
jgi:predicted extracellular nuclease